MKVAFLDRDGTIIRDYPDEQWRGQIQPEFLKGSIEGIDRLVSLGYQIIVVTNQYLIGDKIITQNEYDAFTKKFLDKLKESNIHVLAIYYCPHATTASCNCRKPKPGLIEQALIDYPSIDLNQSFLVGDSIVDLELANYFGMRAFGINIESKIHSYIRIESLYHVADLLLNNK